MRCLVGDPQRGQRQTARVTMPQRLPQLLEAPVLLRAFTYEDVPLIQEVSADPLIPLYVYSLLPSDWP